MGQDNSLGSCVNSGNWWKSRVLANDRSERRRGRGEEPEKVEETNGTKGTPRTPDTAKQTAGKGSVVVTFVKEKGCGLEARK